MSDPFSPERRENPRQPVRAYAELTYSDKGWDVYLLDMSATGACLALLEEHLLQAGDDVSLTIDLSDVQLPEVSVDDIDPNLNKTLHLRGTLVHLREHLLGVEYRPASDLDHALLALLLAQPE
jgi:hypothetical protein